VTTVADPGYTNGEQGRGAQAPKSSAVGARIEEPQAPRGVGVSDAPSPEKKSILDLKMATIVAFLALFLQFSYLV